MCAVCPNIPHQNCAGAYGPQCNCSCCKCSNVNDCGSTVHQWVDPDLWPVWGYNGQGSQDLTIGDLGGGGPPGSYGSYCNSGATYKSPDAVQWCGGTDWGETDVEVWRRVQDKGLCGKYGTGAREGKLLRSLATPTACACKAACGGVYGCKAWQWIFDLKAKNSKQCYLRDTGGMVPNTESIAGTP